MPMKVDRGRATPLYVQLKNILLSKISNGIYPVDQRLPSERELSETYQMSRMTVRKALTALAQDGWLYTQPGKGTYACVPKLEHGLVIMGFTERARKLGMTASSKVIEQAIIPANSDVALHLNLPLEKSVWYMQRVRLMDDNPILLEKTYISLEACPIVPQFDYSYTSLYEVIEGKCNIILARADQTLEAVMATEEQAELLSLELPAALMYRQRVTYDINGRPVEYVRGYYRGDRYKFDITLCD